jgi:hypothetical protein
VVFLGYVISVEGIFVDTRKVEAYRCDRNPKFIGSYRVLQEVY